MSTAGDQIVKLLHINLESFFYVCCHNSHTPHTQPPSPPHVAFRVVGCHFGFGVVAGHESIIKRCILSAQFSI